MSLEHTVLTRVLLFIFWEVQVNHLCFFSFPIFLSFACHQPSAFVRFLKNTKGEGRREKGEGRREKGEGRREKGEGRREKGEGRWEKGEESEGRKEKGERRR